VSQNVPMASAAYLRVCMTSLLGMA
jgi:hypothetical protein